MKRTATAIWNGTGKDGSGHVTSQSNTLNQTPYSYLSRFEDGSGTNPEELIAAAHAGCFAMKLSFLIAGEGLAADELNATAEVTLEDGAISSSHIILKAQVPGMDANKFSELVADAEANCPISKVLNTNISVEHTLNS